MSTQKRVDVHGVGNSIQRTVGEVLRRRLMSPSIVDVGRDLDPQILEVR